MEEEDLALATKTEEEGRRIILAMHGSQRIGQQAEEAS